MRPAYYREQWTLIKPAPTPEQLRSLAQRVASIFIDRYFYSDEYNAEYIELLCEMATCFEDPSLNQIAARTLFGTIVERLCDDFEELQTETYNRLICQVASSLRALPGGARLDTQLNAFHMHAEEQLYQRIESMRLSPDAPLPADMRPRRVLVLSRVTIGADVAVTSVICQRLQQQYPEAEVVVLGNAKLRQIIAPESGIRVRELHYSRHGGLVERFSVWLDLVEVVNEELDGLSAQQYLVLDPDSRLTQLGVLPLVGEHQYRFFNSRGKPAYPAKGSISSLTNYWLDRVLGQGGFCHPAVWLSPALLDTAHRFIQRMSRLGNDAARHVITLNLGVGGNMRKRVAGSFEADLILSLLREPDTVVLLDMGFGEEETSRSRHILEAASAAGFASARLPYRELVQWQASEDVRLFGIECDVGEIASLIARSDEFIGYDSACQHIGAALGVRTYTVFAGTNNARFIRRWHASGPNVSEIVYVDTLSREHEVDAAELIERLRDLRKDPAR
ncbi:MAG: hypothetical protein KDI28_07685 [Pseudomonadales bacterium]|nr:hypothetical protein [Pseudomonadales bacterium]